MKIILASQSPFKKHAIDVLGLSYKVKPSNFDESSIRNKDPKKLAKKLSEAKAMEIGKKDDGIIISTDLFVVFKKGILEKPRNKSHAQEMLKSLSGNTFDIVTGLAVYNSKSNKMLSTVETCRVKFRRLNNFEINDYITRFPALKCAGAFEADGLLRFAERINGNYNFRAATPVNKLVIFLRKFGVKV